MNNNKQKKYTVMVDDNFHLYDEDERYTLGEYDTADEAIKKCKSIVDDFLTTHIDKAKDAKGLYSYYKGFGEDPFIRGPEEGVIFSAWEYARRRCEEIYPNVNPMHKAKGGV